VRLELGSFPVREARLGAGPTRYEGGVLTVDRAELTRLLLDDHRLAGVTLDLVRPGERARVIHILDAVEPRVKVSGGGAVFPGLLGPPAQVGEGRTHRLAGVAVLQTVEEFWEHGGLFVRDAILDMSGPAAPYSPFSRTLNVVVGCRFGADVDFRQRAEAACLAALRTAAYLGRTVRDLEPDDVEAFDTSVAHPGLPRVAYLCFLMTWGEIQKTFVYGATFTGLPTLLHPTEFLDGAVVSGDYSTACFRNTTYLQQNNPVVRGLSRRHGRDLDFAGVVLARTLSPVPEEKQRSAVYAAKLARLLHAQGVVISHDSGGNAVVELMTACQECERHGIRTVLLTEEFSGPDGRDLGLVHYVPEADAIVSTGNRDEVLDLPPVERLVGGDEIVNIALNDTPVPGSAAGAFRTAVRRIFCATNQVGFGPLGIETL
jgi:glycine reductase